MVPPDMSKALDAVHHGRLLNSINQTTLALVEKYLQGLQTNADQGCAISRKTNCLDGNLQGVNKVNYIVYIICFEVNKVVLYNFCQPQPALA